MAFGLPVVVSSSLVSVHFLQLFSFISKCFFVELVTVLLSRTLIILILVGGIGGHHSPVILQSCSSFFFCLHGLPKWFFVELVTVLLSRTLIILLLVGGISGRGRIKEASASTTSANE